MMMMTNNDDNINNRITESVNNLGLSSVVVDFFNGTEKGLI